MQRGQAITLSSPSYLGAAVLSLLRSTLIFCLHRQSVLGTLRLNSSLQMKQKMLLRFGCRRSMPAVAMFRVVDAPVLEVKLNKVWFGNKLVHGYLTGDNKKRGPKSLLSSL